MAQLLYDGRFLRILFPSRSKCSTRRRERERMARLFVFIFFPHTGRAAEILLRSTLDRLSSLTNRMT